MMRPVLLALLFVGLLPPVAVSAQETVPGLEWEKTMLSIETDGSAQPANLTYRFRNAADRPVTILSTSASCGCTIPTPAKTVYAPGESGELPVAHKPKPGAGVHTYRINVQTDEGGGRQHILTLQVTNNPRLTIQPRVINWAKDEARSPKNIDIRIRKGEALKVTGASAQPDVLDVAVTAGPDPDRQTLVITPKPGTGFVPGRVRIQLTTEPPLAPSMDTQFFAVLR